MVNSEENIHVDIGVFSVNAVLLYLNFAKATQNVLSFIIRLTAQTVEFFLFHSAAGLNTLGTSPLVHNLRGFWRNLDTSPVEPVGAHITANVKSRTHKINK